MLRVAVPNKGALSESAAEILSEAGYRRRSDSKDLTVLDPANGVEFFFLRPKDIAIYVGSGELDLGITGRDLALDSGAPGDEILSLGEDSRRPSSASMAQSRSPFNSVSPTPSRMWSNPGVRCVRTIWSPSANRCAIRKEF